MESSKQYKCPSCGANLEYDIGKAAFTCAYCDTTLSQRDVEQIYPEDGGGSPPPTPAAVQPEQPERGGTAFEDEAPTAEESAEFAEYNALYNCPSCGSAIVTDSETAASKCFYCHSPVVLAGKLSGEYRPSKIITFKKDKTAALEALRRFCSGRRFLPKAFQQESTLNEIMAIYIPYWAADCKTSGGIAVKAEKIRTWTSGNYRHTETKYFDVVRSGTMEFDHVPADASEKADDVLTENIEPYDFSSLEPFKMSYLSGFLAEKYTVSKEQVLPVIKKRAVRSAIEVMQNDIVGYDRVTVTSNNININECRWEHLLLPVWFLSYKFKDKMYKFAMNGQTGKVAGDLPIDVARLVLYCLKVLLITLLIFSAGGWLITKLGVLSK